MKKVDTQKHRTGIFVENKCVKPSLFVKACDFKMV